MLALVQSLITRLSRFNWQPTDTPEEQMRRSIVGIITPLVALSLITLLGPLHVVFNEPIGGSLYIGFGLFMLLSLWLYGRWRKSALWLATLLAAVVIPTHLALALQLGGFHASGGIILWGMFYPVIGGLVFFEMRHTLAWLGLFALNVFLSLFLEPWLRPSNNLPWVADQFIWALGILFVTVFTLALLSYFAYQRDQAFRLLRGEQEKAEGLLLNILPPEIAAILKNENRVIADSYEGVSILFADVVNFTPLSTQLTPTELVQLLNEVFSHFDALVEKYGLEKIKTIGDCYMVASGVPRPRADHAQALARMALEMQAFVAQREFHGRRLAFRIGLNSGPVVAGVIGRKKFIYDLWGDAVNTASRMESHGQGGVIQITRATYELLKDEFICEPRGVAHVKGKGEMEVWQVVGLKTA